LGLDIYIYGNYFETSSEKQLEIINSKLDNFIGFEELSEEELLAENPFALPYKKVKDIEKTYSFALAILNYLLC